MVEIIKESNPDLNKKLFLKELSRVESGVALQVTKISDAIPSNRNKKEDFIYIDFMILDDFIGKFKIDESNVILNETININGEIIAIPFTLNESDVNGNYTVGRNKNLFNILNYAMKEQQMIPENNNSSIRCSYSEIITALDFLTFNATAVLVESKDFNNYYRLEVKKGV